MNILIVKTSSLGDIIHAYPVLSYLKEKYPDACIDFIVEKPFSELVTNHPHVSNTILIDTKKWRKNLKSAFQGIKNLRQEIQKKEYDICFDLQCNMKSGVIVSLVRCKNKVGFGFKTAVEKPNCLFNNIRFNPIKTCNVRDENLHIVKSYFNDHHNPYFEKPITLKISEQDKLIIDAVLTSIHSDKPKVMVAPGSIWQNKQVAPQALQTFLKRLEAHLNCSFIFVWGSAKEKEYVEELKKNFTHGIVIDKLSLSALQNLMAKMDLVIAMDSLPLHLAGTTDVSTYSFFGPSSAAKFMPLGKQHHAFQGSCPYGRIIQRRCPILRKCKTGACLREISGDELFANFILHT